LAGRVDVDSIPDLSELARPVLADWVLNTVFGPAGTTDKKASSFVINCIVAVDKAVREYNAGRELMVEYANAGGIARFVESLGHFETSINSVKRALRHIERLSRHPDGPDVDRALRQLLGKYGEKITPLRNAVEHMDETVQDGGLSEGDPHVLSISRDGSSLQVANHKLGFADLAQLLTRLRELATSLAKYQDSRNEDAEQAHPD
jgi:hypothetical protein